MNLELNDVETRVVLRALGRLAGETRKAMKKNEERGWKPEPGRIDVGVALIGTIENIRKRLPYPGPADQENSSC